MSQFLDDYSKEAQQKNVQCDFERHHPDDQACQFDLVYLGPSCTRQNNFGYSIGKPCVLLSPSKIANWIPGAYSNDTLDIPDEVRLFLKVAFSGIYFISCS